MRSATSFGAHASFSVLSDNPFRVMTLLRRLSPISRVLRRLGKCEILRSGKVVCESDWDRRIGQAPGQMRHVNKSMNPFTTMSPEYERHVITISHLQQVLPFHLARRVDMQ